MSKSVYHFELQVQPEQADLTWCATLEAEDQAKLEFTSPLELARFLADLKTEGTENAQTKLATGLR